MAKETIDTGTNKVDVDLDRYTDLILNLTKRKTKLERWKKLQKN